MTFSLETPFGPNPVPEVQLSAAPLAAVIAQVRFPEIAAIARDEFVAPFQEMLRSSYPNAAKEPQFLIIAEDGAGAQHSTASVLWRFTDAQGSWNVVLASGFVALETRAYLSRTDFMHRLDAVLKALETCVRPLTYIRLGLRYIDRFDQADDLRDLARLVRPDLIPFRTLGLDAATTALSQSFAQAEFQHRDAQLRIRSAVLPPGHMIDNATLEPIARQSWVLDIDMFELHPKPKSFDAATTVERARVFAETIYGVFRWAVSDELLERMGGRS